MVRSRRGAEDERGETSFELFFVREEAGGRVLSVDVVQG